MKSHFWIPGRRRMSCSSSKRSGTSSTASEPRSLTWSCSSLSRTSSSTATTTRPRRGSAASVPAWRRTPPPTTFLPCRPRPLMRRRRPRLRRRAPSAHRQEMRRSTTSGWRSTTPDDSRSGRTGTRRGSSTIRSSRFLERGAPSRRTWPSTACSPTLAST